MNSTLTKTQYFEQFSEMVTALRAQKNQLTVQKIAIITDQLIYDLYQDLFEQMTMRLSAQVIVIPQGEQFKTREQKLAIEDQLFAAGCNRHSLIIAVGGGVVTDLVGFVAATFCRGVPLILVPTTLLAMVDASIGGKTAVNTPVGKNLVGAFYSPLATYICPAFIRTLSQTEFLQGLAELTKHFLLVDKILFEQLSALTDVELTTHATLLPFLKSSMAIKQKIVAIDPAETSCRVLLNLGHTVAHALEHVSYYKMPHGLAVWLGMLIEWRCQLTDDSPEWQTLCHFLKRCEFDWAIYLPLLLAPDLYQACQCDKKNDQYSQVQMVAFTAAGSYSKVIDERSHQENYLTVLSSEQLKAACQYVFEIFSK